MDVLKYPFDSEEILKYRNKIKKSLLEEECVRVKKKIAVLGGSTTHDIIAILELFLLDMGIEPLFYESEYAQYWQDAVFENKELQEFAPDFVFIHTTTRNITTMNLPLTASEQECDMAVDRQFEHFVQMWENIEKVYKCPIIQNNFEMPLTRKLGNSDIVNKHGLCYAVMALNMKFSEYARNHKNFYIHDINYLSACYGLDKWLEPKYWYLYKYALCIPAIPEFAYSVSKIFRSLLGKNKKALALDLDNTLWGGVVGDDGVEGIEIGEETNIGQSYLYFQKYIKSQQDIGVLLTVNSKNDYENAIAGLNHPESALKSDDFVCIKANWNSKDENIHEIAQELNILPESIVFVDDNLAELDIVESQIKGIETVEAYSPDECMMILDRSGFFEVTEITSDDTKRNEMYQANAKRNNLMKKYNDYGEYLESLEMTAQIADFTPVYLSRITQLTNKSNQFNLTTKRFTLSQMNEVYESKDYIRLCGRLCDKFGDNGIVSVVIGKIENKNLHIDLWLMSCRVLKREMEYAMLDRLIEECRKRDIENIFGYYYKTAKNAMVKDLYGDFGFEQIEKFENGDGKWKLEVKNYKPRTKYIKINEKELSVIC
jgi:FkbH-like protein